MTDSDCKALRASGCSSDGWKMEEVSAVFEAEPSCADEGAKEKKRSAAAACSGEVRVPRASRIRKRVSLSTCCGVRARR
jgi:hypothetical protein